MPTPEQARQELEARAVQTAETDTLAFCRMYRPQVQHPVRGSVVYEPWPYQRQLLQALDAGGPVISDKARQIGVSATLMIQKVRRCQEPAKTVLVVSRKADTAKELVGVARYAIATCDPPYPVKISKDNVLELSFANGSRIIAESASPEAGRTYAASDVVFDEFAYLPWQKEMWQSVRPTVSRSGNVAVVSSPSLEGDLFHQLWLQSEAEKSLWQRFLFTWRDCPEYGQEWFDRERSNYTTAQWSEEFEGLFGSSANAVFRAQLIEEALEQGQAAREDWTDGVVAADVSGEGRDQSVIIRVSGTPPYRVQVAGFWDVLPAPTLQAYLELAVTNYKVPLWLDSTGLGWAVKQNLKCNSTGIVFTGGESIRFEDDTQTWHIGRTKLVNNAILLFEQGQVAILPGQEQLILGLRSYRWAKREAVNADFVDALIIGLWAVSQGSAGDVWIRM